MHFKIVFGGSWGQHGPKSLPKAARKGGEYSSFVGSWRGLGGLLGHLGAQDLILSIFNRFLIDFLWIFGGFLVEFWSNFDRNFIEILWNLGPRNLDRILVGVQSNLGP